MEKAVTEELRFARHNVRGRLNAVKLCVSALEILGGREEKLEFLQLIAQSADATIAALEVLEPMLDQAGISQED